MKCLEMSLKIRDVFSCDFVAAFLAIFFNNTFGFLFHVYNESVSKYRHFFFSQRRSLAGRPSVPFLKVSQRRYLVIIFVNESNTTFWDIKLVFCVVLFLSVKCSVCSFLIFMGSKVACLKHLLFSEWISLWWVMVWGMSFEILWAHPVESITLTLLSTAQSHPVIVFYCIANTFF